MTTSTQLLGFHTKITTGNDDCKLINGLNIVGYIPLAGIATGIFRIIVAAMAKKNDFTLSGRITMIARGVCETIGLGMLFLIPDILVSIGRHLCKYEPLRT